MKTGTKSLLFGVHHFLWHPYTVYRAWVLLYGMPSFRQLVCIVIHDWGYWGMPDMNGVTGSNHPVTGARIALGLFGAEGYLLCLYHSRSYANRDNVIPSRLCWADKLSILYELGWFYLIRAKLSGELKEYRAGAAADGALPLTATDREWFSWLKDEMVKFKEQKVYLRCKY